MKLNINSEQIERNFSEIHKGANIFLHSFGPAFTETPNGDIKTDIAGAGSISGLAILRLVNPDMDGLRPGLVVLSDVNDGLKIIQLFMKGVAPSLGLNHENGWETDISQIKPLFEVQEMTKRLEPLFLEACSKTTLQPEYFPFIPALTAMKLVSAANQLRLLDQQIGKSLAFYYAVAGSKTVPYPVSRK